MLSLGMGPTVGIPYVVVAVAAVVVAVVVHVVVDVVVGVVVHTFNNLPP